MKLDLNGQNQPILPHTGMMDMLKADPQVIYRRFVESVNSGIFMTDHKGQFIYVNHALVDFLEYKTKDDLIGKSMFGEFGMSEESKVQFCQVLRENGVIHDFEISRVRQDGGKVYLKITANQLVDEQKNLIGWEGIAENTTEQKRLEESLLSEKRKLEQLLVFDEKVNLIREEQKLNEFIVENTARILEAKRCSLMIREERTNVFRIPSSMGLVDAIAKKTVVNFGEPIAGMVAKDRQPLLVKNIEYEKRFQRANRSSYQSRSFMIVPVIADDNLIGMINVADKVSQGSAEARFNETDLKILCSVAREVAVAIENVKLFNKLNILTVTDPLTHIFNYRQFASSLAYEIARFKRTKNPLSLMMLDVDKFKYFNDTFGHLEGDHILREIGQILTASLRETDIICRYAGDEFVVVLPNTPLEGARKAAEKVVSAIERFTFKQQVTVSVGAAQYTDGMTEKDLVRKSDEALYKAKEQGRNRVCTV